MKVNEEVKGKIIKVAFGLGSRLLFIVTQGQGEVQGYTVSTQHAKVSTSVK